MKKCVQGLSRRELLQRGGVAALTSFLPRVAGAAGGFAWEPAGERPQPSDRRFRSEVVEQYMAEVRARIGDPELARLFFNCFPNTLDTTVEPGEFEGKPDTAVITGDIPAMWQRDSSAQVWPYLELARKDERLRALIEGVIRRQTRNIAIDPYANAFMADLDAPPLEWSRHDDTEMKQGVGERKYELDSLCYPIRLAYGYWKRTGGTQPFDTQWHDAMGVVVRTMSEQQRKTSLGPYHFQRTSPRPTDDACTFPFLVPANLFAVTSLRQLSEMAGAILHDSSLAQDASSLADEVELALRQHAIAGTPAGTIWAYEVDGFGGRVLMDDANVPSLLSLPYLNCSPGSALYARTRAFVWSERNPWFFRGSAGEGIGGPHEGAGMIWPMSQTIYGFTSTSVNEVREALRMLKIGSVGSGFIHESYFKDDARNFTRAWFAWANSLFGELIGHLAEARPEVLKG